MTYFGVKSSPKTYILNTNPKPMPQIPSAYPRTQSQTHIPKPNLKPISQTSSRTYIPQAKFQTFTPNPIPILEFSQAGSG